MVDLNYVRVSWSNGEGNKARFTDNKKKTQAHYHLRFTRAISFQCKLIFFSKRIYNKRGRGLDYEIFIRLPILFRCHYKRYDKCSFVLHININTSSFKMFSLVVCLRFCFGIFRTLFTGSKIYNFIVNYDKEYLKKNEHRVPSLTLQHLLIF